MTVDFVSEVVAAVKASSLLDKFRETTVSKSSGFGNAHVEYESDVIKLRFVQDRGEVSVTFSLKSKTDWWPIEYICEVANKANPGNDLASNIRLLDSLSGWMEENFSADKIVALQDRIKGIQDRHRQEFLER